MFENQLVPLHPKYDVAFIDGDFIIKLNPEYVELTEKYRLNILALCGRNGVGKSTFLRLLSGRHSHEAEMTICWRDKNGEIAINKKAELTFLGERLTLDTEVHNFSLSDLCGNKNLGEENSIRRSFLEVYASEPDVFQLHGSDVFDGFHLDFEREFTDLLQLEKDLSEHLGLDKSIGNLPDIAKNHPIFHVLASIAEDSTFRGLVSRHLPERQISFAKLYQALRDKESDAIERKLFDLLYENGNKGGSYERDGGAFIPVDPNWKKYQISDYFRTRDTIIKLSAEVDDWIKRKMNRLKKFLWNTEHLSLHLEKGRLFQILDFRPYKIHETRLFHFEDLSSGEQYQIRLLFELAPKIMPDNACWFFEDDLDEFFHPEWKRTLVAKVLKTYFEFTNRIAKSTKKQLYRERTSTFLIATHSPFVLSDLPKECVLRFNKELSGKTSISRPEENTFAGNIGELFHTEFFMESTIGEFARNEIKIAIRELDRSHNQKSLTSAKRLFSLVGDDVLKNLLLEKIRHAEDRINSVKNKETQ